MCSWSQNSYTWQLDNILQLKIEVLKNVIEKHWNFSRELYLDILMTNKWEVLDNWKSEMMDSSTVWYDDSEDIFEYEEIFEDDMMKINVSHWVEHKKRHVKGKWRFWTEPHAHLFVRVVKINPISEMQVTLKQAQSIPFTFRVYESLFDMTLF